MGGLQPYCPCCYAVGVLARCAGACCADADVFRPSFCACPWLPVRFGSSAGRRLQSPPSVPIGTTSVVAGSCLLRSRLARFALRIMYAHVLVLWLPASYVGTTAPVRRLLRRLLLECRCGCFRFLRPFRPRLLASAGYSGVLRRGVSPRHPPTVSACLSAVGYGLPFLLVYSDNNQPTKMARIYKNQLIKIHNFS